MDSPPLYLVEERVKTFKKWPFNDKNKCNVRNMAEAGFYSIATGDDDADSVKCFLCGKELDGWEADDDPWKEHRSHASKCIFAVLGRKEDELRLSEFLFIVQEYMTKEVERIAEIIKNKIDERAKKLRRDILMRE